MADRDYTPEEREYANRLFDLVLNTVIDMDGDGTGAGGFVRPHVIRMVLAEVAATVDFNCKTATTPRDVRLQGEGMGARYSKLLKQLNATPELSAWPTATLVPDKGKAN